MLPSLYPFALAFDGLYARFPFIFDGKPAASTGVNGEHRAPCCIISSRAAGNMVFRGSHSPAREGFFYSLGIPPEKVYSLIQVHSHDVFTVGAPDRVLAPKDLTQRRQDAEHAEGRETGDGMVSFSPDIFLAVTVADCLPVFLLDTENGYWSVLHSGWQGTGIVLKALEIMRQAGTRPEALAAVLGPCIQSCCYRVDEERAKHFEEEFGSTNYADERGGKKGDRHFLTPPVSRRDDDGWYIDLQAANVRLLADAGVLHIAHCTDCTFTDERLGSFRREGQFYTRMIAMAG